MQKQRMQPNGFSQNGGEDSSQTNVPSQNPLTQIGSWGTYSQPGALSSFSQTGFSQMDFSQDSVIGGGAGAAAGLLSQDSTYHGERLLSDNTGFLSQMWWLIISFTGRRCYFFTSRFEAEPVTDDLRLPAMSLLQWNGRHAKTRRYAENAVLGLQRHCVCLTNYFCVFSSFCNVKRNYWLNKKYKWNKY